MRKTHVSTLIGVSVAGIVIAYLVELAFVTSGASVLIPPLSLPITLIAIAVVVLLLAWPVRRAVKHPDEARINPFHAARVAVLAKASSLAGGLLVGVAIGIVFFLLTRSVISGFGPVWLAVATAIGSVLLLAAGLIAERFCTLPPDDPEQESPGNV